MGLSSALETTDHLSNSANWLNEFRPDLAESNLDELCVREQSLVFPSLAAFGDASISVTYDKLISATRQTINAFSFLSVSRNEPVAILLPHIPQAYYAMWAAETLGIANPINPNLSADSISLTLASTKPRILVTLGPLPNVDVWNKAIDAARNVSSIQTILSVDLSVHLSKTSQMMNSLYSSISTLFHKNIDTQSLQKEYKLLDFEQLVAEQPSDQLPPGVHFDAQRLNSYFELSNGQN